MELAAAITAGALGIIVLLFGGYVFPLVASSSLNCICYFVFQKNNNDIKSKFIISVYLYIGH